MSRIFEPTLLPLAEKERLVEDLLGEFGLDFTYHRARGEYIIPCRISASHRNQDHDPTGAFNVEKLVYKCLGCKASGGLLWFIAWHRGEDVKEAREWLGKETGTDGNLQDLSSLLRYFDALQQRSSAKTKPPVYSERMLEPWALIHPWVTDPPSYDEHGRNLGGRGIPEETVLKYGVGYAEHYQVGKKLSERIVIPHFWHGELVGWQSRRLADDGTPKYLSTPEMPKDSTLFDYDPEHHDVAVVVESPMSTLRHAHHVHMPATFGANITDTQIRLISRYQKVIYWLDNDPAGWDAYAEKKDRRGKVIEPGLLERTAARTDVWVVLNPYDADPADLDDSTAEGLIAQAVPWVLWEEPKALLCPRCGLQTHQGGCRAWT